MENKDDSMIDVLFLTITLKTRNEKLQNRSFSLSVQHNAKDKKKQSINTEIRDQGSISPTFYEQLLRLQFPKDSQVKQLFCAFGICARKSCL